MPRKDKRNRVKSSDLNMPLDVRKPAEQSWTNVQFDGGATNEMRKELLAKQAADLSESQSFDIVQIFEELGRYALPEKHNTRPRYPTYLACFKELTSTINCQARDFSYDEVILWTVLELQDTGLESHEFDDWLQHDATVEEIFAEVKATLTNDRIDRKSVV